MPVQTARYLWNSLRTEVLGDVEGEGWGGGAGLAGASALTWFVLLALGGDGERVHVQPQIPGHGVQQQHGEGPVRVGVVEQCAQLPALQPVAAHIPLRIQEGRRGGLCSEKSPQLTTPLKKRRRGVTPQIHSLGQVQSPKARKGNGRGFARTGKPAFWNNPCLP